jgi:hypothetical protein
MHAQRGRRELMPKFMTYQRPAPVSRQNWNLAPDRKAEKPRKAPEKKSEGPTLSLAALEQLLRQP